MFRSLFKPDSPLMITMGQITDIIFLSLFWFLCCFPLVTAGAATAAMYDAVYHTFRKGGKHSWQRYWSTFRSGLKGSLVSSVIFVALVCLLGWAGIRLWNNAVYGNISWMLFAAGAFVLFLFAGILSIVFPMYSRFENPTARLWGNTFRLGMARLPLTLLLAAVNVTGGFLCIRYIVPLFFLPALVCLISTLFLEPMFRPFMPETEEE